MTNITTFPTIHKVSGNCTPITLIADATIKAGQVVGANASNASNKAIPNTGTTQSLGVAIYDAIVGMPVAIANIGSMAYVANADDTTAIPAGVPVSPSSNAVGGTVKESGANVVGITIDIIPPSGVGRIIITNSGCNVRTATVVVAAHDSQHQAAADITCDGVNDAALIQAEIDRIAGPMHIHFMGGRYVFTDMIDLDQAWIKISGDGNSQIDLDHSGGKVSAAFSICNDHIEISGINFEFTDTTVHTMPPRCIRTPSDATHEWISIHDCNCIGIPTAGESSGIKHTTISKAFETGAGKHWSLKNNFFKGASWEGISVGNVAATELPEHYSISGNVVEGLSDRCFGGIVVEHGAENCSIVNNTINSMNAPAGYGIYVISGDSLRGSDNVTVAGNTIRDVKYGIKVRESTGVSVTGNTIKNVAYNGIDVGSRSRMVDIVGNVIRNTSSGVHIKDSPHIQLNANTIAGCDYGIVVKDSKDLVVHDNTIAFCKYSDFIMPWSAGGYYLTRANIRNNMFQNANTLGGSYANVHWDNGATVTEVELWNNTINDTQSSIASTLDGAASIDDTEIVVDDATEFGTQGVIRIGTAPNHDDVRVTDIDYHTETITFTPALTNDHADASDVVGRSTLHKAINRSLGDEHWNIGFTTENSGTDLIGAAAQTKDVTHGLAVTPAAGDIIIVPTATWGAVTKFWISAYASDTFTVSVDQVPGGAGFPFAWKAIVL